MSETSTATAKDTSTATTADPYQGFNLGGNNPGQIDITSNRYNITGLGLNPKITGNQTTLSADEFIQALMKTAYTDPKTWAGIQWALYQSNFYGGATPSFGAWNANDKTGVTRFMQALTVLNPDKTKGASVTKFLTTQQNQAITLGGNQIRTRVAKAAVPNTLDITTVFDKAYRAATGEAPTAAQSKKFAAEYQSQVLGIARANAMDQATTPFEGVPTMSPSEVPAIPGATTNGKPAVSGTTATPLPSKSIAENFAAARNTSPVSVVAQQQVADPTVAATEFARKSAPDKVAAQNIDLALNAMFSSLARNSQ